MIVQGRLLKPRCEVKYRPGCKNLAIRVDCERYIDFWLEVVLTEDDIDDLAHAIVQQKPLKLSH